MSIKIDTPLLLNVAQAGKLLGIGRTTIFRRLRDDPNFPKPGNHPGGKKLWHIDDIRRYAALFQRLENLTTTP